MEWKPVMAPQATVMNMKLHIGVPSGCILVKLSHISGMPYCELTNIPNITPTAITMRQTPKMGYIFPMILSMERNVAMK